MRESVSTCAIRSGTGPSGVIALPDSLYRGTGSHCEIEVKAESCRWNHEGNLFAGNKNVLCQRDNDRDYGMIIEKDLDPGSHSKA